MDRYHNFEYIIYYEEKILKAIIDNDKNILHYAFIYHDKDTISLNDINNNDKYANADLGKIKVSHYHLLVNFKNAKNFNSALNEFVIQGYTTRCIPILEDKKVERYEYLTHTNDADKYQYDSKLIVCDNPSFWVNVRDKGTEKTINILDDILNNVPLRELVERYGRDLVINYGKYREFAFLMGYQEKPNSPKVADDPKFLADSRDGLIVAVEDRSIQTDFLLNL